MEQLVLLQLATNNHRQKPDKDITKIPQFAKTPMIVSLEILLCKSELSIKNSGFT